MSGNRILVIDDEDDIREVAQMSLEAMGGWQVLTAHCGAAGLVTAAAERPDVILLDVMMPDMDGPTTFQRLRTDPATADIPVVFLTAKVRSADRQFLTDLGGDAVLSKPFDPVSLSDEIIAALDWPPR
ncbi:response regulator [Blastococcus saxobsidens]|uniref:Two-component response regulator receiver n=1 Tax=Blastococcus saxobsidens (strain DD2) TaxID=1146883 RepID=H6RP39_BLASD|nr:response regulator [Blastococcus saxobsidens]CCG02700.1 Two-component response regulator receiver [Blastococcus saxobsidens DD2]